MIVRCAKCKDLLAYNSRLSSLVVDRCANGCDAGVQVSPGDTEVIDDCWYGPDAERLRKTRAKIAEPEPESKIHYCWYVEQPEHKPMIRGIFHGWGSVSVGNEKGDLVQDSIALVETSTGHILNIPTNQIQFRTPKEKS